MFIDRKRILGIFNKYKIKLYFFLVFSFVPSISYARSLKSRGEGGIVSLIMAFGIFMGIILFFVGGVMLLIYKLKKVTRKKVIDYCKQNDIKYVENAPKLPVGDDFNLVNIEKNKTKNFNTLMVGNKNDVPFILGEYSYKLIDGNNICFIIANFCVMSDDNLDLPSFFLKTRQIGIPYSHTLDKFLSGKKIALEKNGEFTSNFVLKTDHSDSVKSFFNDKVVEVFNNYFPENCVCEAKRGTIILFVNAFLSFDNKIKFLDESVEFFSELRSALKNYN